MAKATTGKVNLGNIAKEALYDRYGGRPEPKQPVRMPGTAVTPASVAKNTKTAVRPVTRPSSSPAIKPLTTTQSQRDPKTGCSANGSGTGYGYANGTNSYVKTTPSILGNLKERWTDPTTMINDLSTAISIAGLGGYGIYKTGKVIDTFMKNRNTIAKVTGKSQGSIPMNLQFFGGKGGGKPGGTYIPKDASGNLIPLQKQRVNGQDIPLPNPVARGPHTVLGGKISSETGMPYRQSATFPSGTWPTAKGQNVPWSEVHWGDHGSPKLHSNPHQHIIDYIPEKSGWYRQKPTNFYY